jgi:hypothetical protein
MEIAEFDGRSRAESDAEKMRPAGISGAQIFFEVASDVLRKSETKSWRARELFAFFDFPVSHATLRDGYEPGAGAVDA